MQPIHHATSALFTPLHSAEPTTPPLDHKELENYLLTIDDHLARQIQIPLDRVSDKKFLPAVIGLANQKYPGLNLHLEPEAPLFGARTAGFSQPTQPGPGTAHGLFRDDRK